MKEGKHPLVIGIGNVLRGDDGAGFRVAEALRDGNGHNLVVITVDQLTPELAACIASASRVLFVDASADPLRSGLMPLDAHHEALATSMAVGLSHTITPPVLMALADVLYHHRPPAWQLLIPAEHWDHGIQLSVVTTEACGQALAMARAWGHSHA